MNKASHFPKYCSILARYPGDMYNADHIAVYVTIQHGNARLACTADEGIQERETSYDVFLDGAAKCARCCLSSEHKHVLVYTSPKRKQGPRLCMHAQGDETTMHLSPPARRCPSPGASPRPMAQPSCARLGRRHARRPCQDQLFSWPLARGCSRPQLVLLHLTPHPPWITGARAHIEGW